VPQRRENHDDFYFTDRWQGQPAKGYAALFENLLHGIRVHFGVNKNDWRHHRRPEDWVIFTGKIDDYYQETLGRLPYRSLRFEHDRSPSRLPHAVINQCNDLPFTRVYDHAWFSGESPELTVITREFPEEHHPGNEPYYPMPFGEGMKLYSRYKSLGDREPQTLFIGRLATYSYLDMWMAVAEAMAKVRPFLTTNS
jgi:UDP-galactopyranose mutase